MIPNVLRDLTILGFNKIKKDIKKLIYVSAANYDINGNPKSYVDANPTKYPKKLPANAWIGSLINEPLKGETANSKIYIRPAKDFSGMPKYPGLRKINL